MSRPLTTNAKGWQRIGRVVQEVEGSPLLSTRGRAKYPIAPGQSSRRVYITEDDGGDPVPIYRGSHPDGFTCADRLDGTGEITVHTDLMRGASFTGQIITVQRIKMPTAFAAKWQVVSTGENQWASEASEDIVSTGTASVPIGYWRDEIYTAAGSDDITIGVQDQCFVPAELFNASSPVASGQQCWVMLREDFATGETMPNRAGSVMFVVIPRNCPDFLDEV